MSQCLRSILAACIQRIVALAVGGSSGHDFVHGSLPAAVGAAATVLDALDEGIVQAAVPGGIDGVDHAAGVGGTTSVRGLRVATAALKAQAQKGKGRSQKRRQERHGQKETLEQDWKWMHVLSRMPE